MKALVYDSDAAENPVLREAPDPDPGPGQVLVRVQALSLNRGEVRDLHRNPPGTVPGWDAAGTVVEPAASGGGPAPGARVVTFGWGGGWAELRAVDTNELAVLPDGVDAGDASALPVAGVTALRSLRSCGDVSGKRVLITGASGGIGRFAVQLAHGAGARVVAVVGSPERGAGLDELGADEVAVGIGSVEAPVHAALDTAGGPLLAAAADLVEEGGVLVAISGEPGTALPRRVPGRQLVRFGFAGDAGEDLGRLVGLLAEGRLDPQVGWRGPWERAAEVARLLMDRKVKGKAALDVSART